MPRLSEQILLLVAWGRVFFGELGEMLERPYWWGALLGKKDRAVRRALGRLVSRGELRRSGRAEKARYSLTKLGKVRVMELRPQLGKKTWDRRWRIVVFDIPERYRGMRAVLRRFLRSTGFAPFQRSLWVTPFDVTREVRTFLRASRLSEMAFLMEVKRIWGLEHKDLAEKVWGLTQLSESYEKFAQECERSERVTLKLRQRFVRLIFNDPLLPKEILPKVFSRAKALGAYRDLVKKPFT